MIDSNPDSQLFGAGELSVFESAAIMEYLCEYVANFTMVFCGALFIEFCRIGIKSQKQTYILLIKEHGLPPESGCISKLPGMHSPSAYAYS